MASTKKTLERLELIFTANQEQFDKQLKSIEDSIAGVKGSVDGVSAGMGKTMTGAMTKASIIAQVLIKAFEKVIQVIGKVVRAVFNLGKNLLASGSQLTRMRVATNTLARNLGITQEELDGLRDSLAESNTYGIKAEQVISSLARTGLMEMAKSLEAVDARTGSTVKGVNALVLTMKDLGAVAGKSSSEAIAQITDFISRGRTEAVEGMIAIGNLGTEYREFAKTLGKGRGELTAQEEAQARLNIVQREGAKAFGAYAEAYTTSGKMLDSITDTTKSAFEELGAMLEPIWASATTAILGFVQNVRNFINQNEQVIKNWATKVAGWVVYVAETIAQFLSKIPVIGSVFQSLTNIQVKVAKSSEGMDDAIEGEADTMDDASGSASKLNKELRGLAGFDEMNVLKEPETGGGGGGASTTALTTPGIFENFGAEVDKVIDDIKNKISDKLDPIKKKLEEFFEPMVRVWKTWVEPAWQGLKASLDELFASVSNSPIGEILETIAQIIGVVIVGAIGVLINIITGVVAIIKWAVDSWKKNFDRAVEFIANLIVWFRNFDENVATIVENVKQWFEGMSEKIKEIWENVTNWMSEKWNSVTGWIEERINTIGSAFSGLGDKMKNIWDTATGWIGTKWTETTDWIKNKINDIGSVFNGFGDKVKGVWNRIKDDAVSAFNTLKGKLTGIFDNIGSGISNSFEKVVNRLKWLINSFVVKPLNSARSVINMIPGVNIKEIPYLASGGVVEEDTLAMLHRSSKEAVLPLKGNTEWISELAGMINSSGGGGGNLIVKIGDDTIYEKAIDYIREKGLRTGTNILNL